MGPVTSRELAIASRRSPRPARPRSSVVEGLIVQTCVLARAGVGCVYKSPVSMLRRNLCWLALSVSACLHVSFAGAGGWSQPEASRQAAIHVFNVTGVPDGNVLNNFREMLITFHTDCRSESHRENMRSLVQDENERLFNALEQHPDSLEVEDALARDAYRAMRLLHESGDGYAALEAATGHDRQSTVLWAKFSRDAATSFLSHSPRYFLEPMVSPWIHESMFSGWPYSFAMQLALMLLSSEWSSLWSSMLEESPVGAPPMLNIGSHALLEIGDSPSTSSNRVHQVFHLFLFRAVAGVHVWEAAELVKMHSCNSTPVRNLTSSAPLPRNPKS